MKEFSSNFVDIFGGLISERSIKKQSSGLEECHNLEPLKEDYVLHELVVDMNATGYDWNNNPDLTDYWTDHSDDDWTDNQDDEFTDI